MPTADLPGIGASMRMWVAARAMASSLERPSILLTLTPTSGRSSNLVTVGPTLAWITLAMTPKLFKVDSIIDAFLATSLWLSPLALSV